MTRQEFNSIPRFVFARAVCEAVLDGAFGRVPQVLGFLVGVFVVPAALVALAGCVLATAEGAFGETAVVCTVFGALAGLVLGAACANKETSR